MLNISKRCRLAAVTVRKAAVRRHLFAIVLSTVYIQDSLASLGAGFGSASADIILLRIPALFVPLRSALSERPPDVQRPRGAFIRWGIDTRH